jgi:general stress protein 26
MNAATDQAEENLTQESAIGKIRELGNAARVCLFGTSAGNFPLTVRPMGVADIDAAGVLWFLSGRSSMKNWHIAHDPRVQLFFSNPSTAQYLSLTGAATISDDQPLREKYWTPLARAWFAGGVDDPELTVIRVRPESGYYWDTEHGKTVALLKIALAAVTGHPVSEGAHGTVKP